MNTTRMTELAKSLSALLRERATCNVTLSHLSSDMEARKVAITPEGGWPGKNAEERKFAESVTCGADEPMKAMRNEHAIKLDRQAFIEAEISALETERRALEWSVRGALVDALMGVTNSHSDVAESSFDDAAQMVVDETVFETAAFVDDLPF